jgi:hypothetical protein
MNLGVEAEFAGDEKRDRKSSPKVRRKFVGALDFETSALDLGGYEWQLAKRAVLSDSARRGLRRHIYSVRVLG